MIVPDVSFVIRRPFETSGTTTNDLVEHLFNRPRMHHKFVNFYSIRTLIMNIVMRYL